VQHSNHFTRAISLSSLCLAAACGGGATPEPSAPAPTPEPSAAPEPPAPMPEAPPEAATTTPPAIPEKGEAANHYLDAETWFAATMGYDSNYIYADPAKQLTPPGQDGKAKLWDFYAKKEIATQHFWKTRATKKEELAVGKLALMAHKRNSEGSFVAPASVKEAYSSRWWITRIVSVRPIAEGYVLLAGNFRAAPDAIRFLEGDDSPSIEKQGKEDAHFIAEEHWFAGRQPLPDKNYVYVDPAVPVNPDDPLKGGEGSFVLTNSGHILQTANAWQTRIAKPGELKKGKLVIAPHIKDGATYRAPKTRAEALASRWWAVKISDTKNLAKGTVGVEGGYQVATKALRVVK